MKKIEISQLRTWFEPQQIDLCREGNGFIFYPKGLGVLKVKRFLELQIIKGELACTFIQKVGHNLFLS